MKKNPAVRAAGFFVGSLHAKTKATRSWFYLGMNRCRCQKPPARADGGSWGSCSPAEVLPQLGLPVDVLDLHVLRSRAALLQRGVPRSGASPAASRGQSAASAEHRRAAGSSRPAACLSLPAVSTPRDGSRFPIDSSGSPSGSGKAVTMAGACAVACSAAERPGFWLRCVVCGRAGRLVDPFPRTSSRR